MSSLDRFATLQIPLEEIVSATNNFAEENLIGEGVFAKVYKGQILRSKNLINIAARRLHRNYQLREVGFWSEISMLSSLKHKNLVTIVGFCDEEGEKIIVNKHESHGSLDKYLARKNLTWMQILRICDGIARAVSYIHYDVGRDYSVIHCNIKSSKVLLDDNLEAKIFGFERSMKNSTARRHRVLFAKRKGALRHVDPAYGKTQGVTHKSDVLAFGVVLFEVLYGRKTFNQERDNVHFARLATLHYEEGKLDEIINHDLRKQMDLQSLNIFSETAYYCLKNQQAQRPNIDHIVLRLDKALEFQRKHENLEHSTIVVEGTSSSNWKGGNLEHLKIRLKDIELATDNFSETYRIGSGGYGVVYKAELDYFDVESSSKIERGNKNELPTRRGMVAIKRIFNREDRQGKQGFFVELEMLTSCKHRNIVSLLGFCDEGPQMILIYEYAPNGSLDDYLGNMDNMINLSWAQRIQMCLDIAHGLNYLHTSSEDKQWIIHRDIKSANILLGGNWEAKIADFGLSKSHPMSQKSSTLNTNNIAGTEVYLDPEYEKTGKLKKQSDIYSFGVVLFEILCGRLAYDEFYNVQGNDKGLPPIARRRFHEGTLQDIMDPKLIEETDENIFSLNKGPNQDSLDTFSQIAFQCIAETQVKRPTMIVVIKELEKALYLQENRKHIHKIQLKDIILATENFNHDNYIRKERFGMVYRGDLSHADGLKSKTISAKRLDSKLAQNYELLTEVEILFEYKHENVIGLVGYCNEMDEKIIVCEYASNGSLDRHLNDVSLTWMKRLKICIDVASGLNFLHGGVVTQEAVIHRSIKSPNILLDCDWKAKIANFELSVITPINKKMDFIVTRLRSRTGYEDPQIMKTGFLTRESDIYSFGVLLCEILCGGPYIDDDSHATYLEMLVKHLFKKGNLDEMVFEGIKEQIMPQSLTSFQKIAYQCLHDEREKRPTTSEVIIQLKKALAFQEDYEIWEPKLPIDYKEMIQMSKNPEIYRNENKKDLYEMFSKGILLREGKVWFSLGINGERNELISARKFSFKNRKAHKWRYVPESRFSVLAVMSDISNMKIKIKLKLQFLSLGVVYGVHLVFKFCGPRKFSSKSTYVNLTYQKGSDTDLHAYFATWRDEEWMMIELCRFLNHKEDTDFEVLLESFSRYYCRSDVVYVEGIEFRAINNVKREQVLKSNSDIDQVQQSSADDDSSLSKMNEKKWHILSAVEAIYNSSNTERFHLKPSTVSRFQEVIEVLSHQVIHIKCKIESEKLYVDTNYVCFLVFKLSEKCRGLHCPVKVRDLLNGKNKETKTIYLRSPSSWNLHDINHVPKQRKDGWFEVNVWKFNSKPDLKNGCIPVNLKLISYEGTMSGLIICSLEFRPM